jgi:hypothetical protein
MKREARGAGSGRLWKATLDRQLGLDEVEGAAGESVAVLLGGGEPSAADVSGVELERMDVDREGRTTVFFSGSEEGARAFGRCLKVAARGAEVCCDPASARELFAPPS